MDQEKKLVVLLGAIVGVVTLSVIAFVLSGDSGDVTVSGEPTVSSESEDEGASKTQTQSTSEVESTEDTSTTLAPNLLQPDVPAQQPAASDDPETGEAAPTSAADTDGRIPIIFDTDANNEIDDQIALAYLLLNGDTFEVIGVTTNDTGRGGPIARHTQEAQYVVDLVGLTDSIPVVEGVDAGGTFDNRRGQVAAGGYQGQAAVDFIVEEAKKYSPDNKLVLAPVGKITNIALALEKDPSIAPNIKILAIAGNYTNSGAGCPLGQDCESNLFQGASGFNAILDSPAEFEMFPALPASGQGSASITVSAGEIASNLGGQGPTVPAIPSPRGPSFTNIGDYIALLFNGANGKPIYDTAPVAALIDPSVGDRIEIPAPSYTRDGRRWIERPNNDHSVAYWDFLDTGAINQDIFDSFKNPVVRP